ncbi:MAG: endonuclease/exonuclease/phosphatase family protein [Bacteroidales bacterium]|nr:endonuclease/exonuclease/phosphatase family protein [Bacteroidales bacterium]
MKKLFFAVLAALAVSACCQGNSESIKVMSFNVRNAKAADGDNAWELRRSATIAMLDEVQPDVFGLQEAYPEQEEYITSERPKYVAYGIGRNDGIEGERMSVVYNTETLQMLECGTWWLSETPDIPSVGWDAKYPRTATWALLKDLRCGREFYLVNTHLDHRGVLARRYGLAMVMDLIRQMNPDTPLILMGDFNVEPGDECLTDVEALMCNARSSAKVTEDTPSFNGFKESEGHKTIDYIYYKGFSGAESFKVLNQPFDGKPFISDHYPIVATIDY